MVSQRDWCLFLIVIINLPNISNNLKFHIFADDITIYFDCDTNGNLVKNVKRELELVKIWLDVNMLSLNINKTNHIIFHSPLSLLIV